MFHFQNLAFMLSSFLMRLFLIPAEISNKITFRKGKYFTRRISSVSTDTSANMLADTSVGLDSLPLPRYRLQQVTDVNEN